MRSASSPPELHRLSKTETLVLVPCGAGAYNYTSVPVIATGIPGRRVFRFAGFDYQPGWSEEAGHPMLVNADWAPETATLQRSEEHTSELQSLMRISYAVFCLKKK